MPDLPSKQYAQPISVLNDTEWGAWDPAHKPFLHMAEVKKHWCFLKFNWISLVWSAWKALLCGIPVVFPILWCISRCSVPPCSQSLSHYWQIERMERLAVMIYLWFKCCTILCQHTSLSTHNPDSFTFSNVIQRHNKELIHTKLVMQKHLTFIFLSLFSLCLPLCLSLTHTHTYTHTHTHLLYSTHSQEKSK